MAKVGKNIVTTGMTGKMGDLIVFRISGGQTIVATKPVKSHVELTKPQKQQQRKFQHAVLYGKSIFSNPALKAQYQAKANENQSAYNVAVADFLNAPDIDEINVSKYTGQAGSTILITVTDDFMVTGVQVEIYTGEGELVEMGDAIQDANHSDWLFTATANNGSISGDKIVIKATDLPGNITQMESIL
jgi:hypothetical protein